VGDSPSHPARVLLTGRPGIGKTTVAARVAEVLASRGVAVTGFVTTELRTAGRRTGFAVETFTGERAVLAHVELRGPPRVSRYGIDVEAFERVAIPALERVEDDDVVVIDELGKMELASERFCEAVLRVFERPLAIVATVHVAHHQLTDALKRRPGVAIVTVSHANRAELPERLAADLARR
jgi:nucleoside-triphosphatase